MYKKSSHTVSSLSKQVPTLSRNFTGNLSQTVLPTAQAAM